MFPALVRCGPTPVKSEHAVASILGPADTRPGFASATFAIVSSNPRGIFVLSAALGLGSQALFAGPRVIERRSIERASDIGNTIAASVWAPAEPFPESAGCD